MRGQPININPVAARRAGCAGCLGIVGFVGFILWMTMFSNTCARMLGQETYPFKSDTRHLDPFAALVEVRARVGKNAHLTQIRATFVRSDGTMDLNADYKPGPHVTYTFQVPLDKAPENAPPIGAGGGPDKQYVQQVDVDCFQPGQRRSVSKISGNSRTSYSYTNEGMDFYRHTATMAKLDPDIGEPKISTQDLWKIALTKGAPKDSVAGIDFDVNGYEFRIRDTKVRFQCDPSGKLKE